MFATSHVIIGGVAGAVAGKITHDPYAAAAVATTTGIISHLLCDSLPHLEAPFRIEYKDGKHDQPIWTTRLLVFATFDSVVAFLLTLLLWWRFFDFAFLSPFAWGALGGYLPDFIDVVPWWAEKFRKLPGFKQFHDVHIGVHKLWLQRFPMNKHWKLGVTTQVVAISVAVGLWQAIH